MGDWKTEDFSLGCRCSSLAAGELEATSNFVRKRAHARNLARYCCWPILYCRSFVEPVLDTYDITVLTFSQATKVLFDESKPNENKAIGVQVIRFGETYNYYSTKETVISGGAIGNH